MSTTYIKYNTVLRLQEGLAIGYTFKGARVKNREVLSPMVLPHLVVLNFFEIFWFIFYIFCPWKKYFSLTYW